MRKPIAALVPVLLAASTTGALAVEPTGTWLVEDKNGIVQIADCGLLAPPGTGGPAPPPPGTSLATGKLCGTIVWLKDPIDPATGAPPLDKHNVDPARRGLPLMGLRVFTDMVPSHTPDRWDGRVYNIDDGKTYDGSLIMSGNDALRIQGCLFLICQGENWTREPVPEPAKAPPPARPRSGGAQAKPIAPSGAPQPRAR